MEKLFDIIHEDNDLLVINKPAGLVCHPTKGDVYSSLISRVRLHLGDGQPAHMINRLDRETGGIVLVAKNAETAGKLGKIWEKRAVKKDYLAIVHGLPVQDQGLIDGPLGKDQASRVAIKDCVRPDGAVASTEYSVMRRFHRMQQPFSLLRVTPLTGRKHQIRIHLQHIGHSIVGDKLYGHDEDCYLALVEGRLTEQQRQKLILPFHALHAVQVSFPWNDGRAIFQAQPEPWFATFSQSSFEVRS